MFTTRIDTIYGATFVVVAPEHPLLDSIWGSDEPELRSQSQALREEQILRGKEDLEKKGFFANQLCDQSVHKGTCSDLGCELCIDGLWHWRNYGSSCT